MRVSTRYSGPTTSTVVGPELELTNSAVSSMGGRESLWFSSGRRILGTLFLEMTLRKNAEGIKSTLSWKPALLCSDAPWLVREAWVWLRRFRQTLPGCGVVQPDGLAGRGCTFLHMTCSPTAGATVAEGPPPPIVSPSFIIAIKLDVLQSPLLQVTLA